MRLDIAFYTQYLNWVITRVPKLATTTPLMLPQFLGEVETVVKSALTVFASFPSTHGNIFSWGPRLLRWIRKNPDPLSTTRHMIEQMYLRWPSPQVKIGAPGSL